MTVDEVVAIFGTYQDVSDVLFRVMWLGWFSGLIAVALSAARSRR